MRKSRKKTYIKIIKLNRIFKILVVLIILICIFVFLTEDKKVVTINEEKVYVGITTEESTKNIEVMGVEDIFFEEEKEIIVPKGYDMEKLKDPAYLKSNFYIVDSRTSFVAEDFNVEEFLKKDFTIEAGGEAPKILIFHTHSHEDFCDSDGSDAETIYGIGEMLAETLSEKYNIPTMHDTGRYDYVDGKVQILGAYERMEPAVRKILEENPSIEMVIDLHRDGVDENIKLVTDIDGKPTARIMFFNGLCKYLENGKLVNGASNPYLEDNLAFSFQMQLKAGELYPNFTRKVYLHAYRFSLHMKARSLLIELGAQTNTIEEAKNAVEPLAEVIAGVLLDS